MSKRRKKQAAPVRHLSTAPLPARLMPGFSDLPLVFTDASRLRHGGLSAVLYADAAGEPLAFARSVPLDTPELFQPKHITIPFGFSI